MKRVLATSMFVAATVGQQVLERELRMLRAPVRTNNESEETDPALDDYVVEEPKSTPVVEPVTPEVEAIEPEEPVSKQI